jgi:hypothetical protein
MSDWWSADPPVAEARLTPRSEPPPEPGPLKITVRPHGMHSKDEGDWWGGDPVVGQEPGVAEDVAKSAGIGVVKGGIGLVGLPGDLGSLVSTATDYVGDKLGIPPEEVQKFKKTVSTAAKPVPVIGALTAPGSADIQHVVEARTGKFYRPKTTTGDYAETVGEFLPAALSGPGGVARRVITQAVLPGIASEAAGQATRGTKYETAARVAAGLGAGGVVALASRPGTAAQALTHQLPKGVTSSMVDDAQRLMEDAATRGVQLTWPEALSQVAGRPVLSNIMRHIEASPQTEARMSEFFGSRASRMDGAARSEFDNVAPQSQSPSAIGPAAGTAAENTINDVRGAINDFTKPMYDRASVQRISPADMARVRAHPGWEEARDAVLSDPQLRRYVEGLPEDSVGFLNEVKKYLDQAGENAAAPVNQQRNMQRAAGYSQDAAGVRTIAERASAAVSPAGGDYAQALAVQAHARETYLQPLLDGPLGKLAAKDTTTRDAINALFPINPLPGSSKEISTAVSAVAKRNPTAARQLVRAHIESVFNEAAKDSQSGANQAGGAKFRARLVGNPQQAENLEAAVRALPDGNQIWTGFERFLEIAEATGTRQNIGSRTAYNAELLKNEAAGRLVGDAGRIVANPTRALQPLVDRYQAWQLGRNLNQLAEILTNPKSANMLRGIAAAKAGSNGARNLALRLVSQGSAGAPPTGNAGNN